MKKLIYILQYIFMSTICVFTTHAMYIGNINYALKGILGIVFLFSIFLENKLKEKNIFVSIAFWISSIAIVSLFVFETFNII